MIDKLNQGIGSLDLHALKYLGRRLLAVPPLEEFKVLFPAKHEAIRARRRYQLTTILEYSEQALRADVEIEAELGGLIQELSMLVYEAKTDCALLNLGYKPKGILVRNEINLDDREPRPLEVKKTEYLCLALINTLIAKETIAERMREVSDVSGTPIGTLEQWHKKMLKSPDENSQMRRYTEAEYSDYQRVLDLAGYNEGDDTKRARRAWLQHHISAMHKIGSSRKPDGRNRGK